VSLNKHPKRMVVTDGGAAMSIVIPSVCVEMGQLGSALTRAVRSIEELGYLRAAHSNLLVFHHDLPPDELGNWIDSLTLVNPSRVFVLSIDDSVEGITLDVGGRCHRVSPSVILCSEVAKVTVPRHRLPELPSVLRAHMLSGARIEAVILQEAIPDWIEQLTGSLAQTVYIDTRVTAGAAQTVPRFWYRKERVIDCAWMWLNPWREVIRQAFDRADLSERLLNLSRVNFTFSHGAGASLLSLLLLPGWIQGRLGLELREVEGTRVLLGTEDGTRSVEFNFVEVDEGRGSVNGMAFFDRSEEPFLQLRVVNEILEGQFDEARSWVPLRRYGGEGSRELLERYFLIGASMTHYQSSFRNAVRLLDGGALAVQ